MQCAGHGPHTASLLLHACDGHAVFGLKLLAVGLILRSFVEFTVIFPYAIAKSNFPQ